MIKVSISEDDYTKFLVCHGDERGLCNSCRVKFQCYTGELPSELCKRARVPQFFDELVEFNLFGSTELKVVDMDYDTHDEYRKVKSFRNPPRFRGVAQFGRARDLGSRCRRSKSCLPDQ